MLQQPIAAEAETESGKRRWVAIYSDLNKSSAIIYPVHTYCVIETVFDSALLAEQEPYGDEDFAMLSQTEHYVTDETELYALLVKLAVDPILFDSPWRVGYPLL
jgi:hypothetical protein